MKNTYSYSFETKRKSIKHKDDVIMSVNLKYPVFENQGRATLSKEKNIASKINHFYEDSAKKYMSYLEKTGAKKALKSYNISGQRCAFVMKSTVSYADDNYISVFSDISFFDGKKAKTKRFSQLWDINRGIIMPHGEIFKENIKSGRYIKDIIQEIATDNLRLKNFSYYDNYKSLISRHFSFSAFYFVPKGIAFYFNAGRISSSDETCVFVIPCEKIDGVMKIALGNSSGKE